MRESVQITLFLKKDTFYNPAKVASQICEKLDYVGSPIILPIDTGVPTDANVPFVIFNQNSKVNIVSNFHNVSITLFDDLVEKCNELITTIFDVFNDISIVRIGYVVSNILKETSYEIIKEESGCNDAILNSSDFKIAWLNNIKINGLEINMWKNYFTDKTNTSDVLRVIDFNTKVEEKITIDREFALKFIDECKTNIK